MKLSASKAAKLAGKSIPTITDAYKSGRLSGTKLSGGGYEFDLSEVERVFGPLQVEGKETPKGLGSTTPISDSALRAELELLGEKLRSANALNDRLADEVADLRTDRDRWREQAQRLLLAPPAPPANENPPPSPMPETAPPGAPDKRTGGFWARLLGR